VDARHWDQRYAESERVWSAEPNQFVVGELADLPPGRALDLAAGEGRNALWLAERGWRVTAVDFSAVGLAKGRQAQERYDGPRPLAIDWVEADVLDYAPGPDSFDLMLIAYLQVVDDQRHQVIRQTFDALGPGGTLLVVAHDSSNLTEGTGGPQDPSVLYTAEDVLADLDGERFEVERAERVERHVEAGTAYDALVRLTRSAPL
jgi:SAM-dependent methyltransferase